MAIQFVCPQCQRSYEIPNEMIGRKLACGQCGKKVRIQTENTHPLSDATPSHPRYAANHWLNAEFLHNASNKPARGNSPSRTPARQVDTPVAYPSMQDTQPPRWGIALALPFFVFLGVVLLALTGFLTMTAYDRLRPPEELILTPAIAAKDNRFVLTFPPRTWRYTLPQFKTRIYTVNVAEQTGNPLTEPGARMQMRIYIPSDDLDAPEVKDATGKTIVPGAGSRSCVLLIPSGGNGFHGMPLDRPDYFDEMIPFVAQGMVVIHFSIDGEMKQPVPTNPKYFWQELSREFPQFLKAKGGVENARFALEYALRHVEEVDPQRIYIVGHGAAATLALQFAATEPRLAGALALSPAVHLPKRIPPAVSEYLRADQRKPIQDYAIDNSPFALVEAMACPLFIFHSREDEVVPFADTKLFVEALQHHGKRVSFAVSELGGHQESVSETHLLKAVNWIREKEQPTDIEAILNNPEKPFILRNEGSSGLEK